MKVDLVMWTKNGAGTLPQVLSQINQVIPKDVVNQKIAIDDSSIDNTVAILKGYGWKVYWNSSGGISSAANQALGMVETDFFCSFEQDLFLHEKWWCKICEAFCHNKKIAASSGFRLPNRPAYLRKLQEYTMEKYITESSNPLFLYGKNLDNTMYRTKIIKEIGGFPTLSISAGVDNALAKRVYDKGYAWRVNFNIISTHLRRGFWHEVKQYWWYGKCYRELKKHLGTRGASLPSIFTRTLFSPIRGLLVARKKKSPLIFFAYPIIRLTILLGVCYSFLRKVK